MSTNEDISSLDSDVFPMDAAAETQSDSRYSASVESTGSPSTPEVPRSRGRPRKRKVDETHNSASHSRVKRSRGSYNDDYRELFNESLDEIISRKHSQGKSLPLSQFGVTIWSPEEKDNFFNSLARHGRHDIRSIAADVASKSESEVHIYLEKLQQAAEDEQLYSPAKKLPRSSDLEAAVEISQDCCDSLESAAEALTAFQQKRDEKFERNRHGDYYLLTPKIAKQVDRRLRAGEDGENEISENLPAASVLNLSNFLTLSKRVFMNSKDMDSNWRTYAHRRRSPVILYTAFSDFYNLAISLTKRLIQSSLFFAMSRLRALSSSDHHNHGHHVRKLDVLAALDVLGLERNARKGWARTARKCRLRVYEEVRHRKIRGEKLSYDEIEEALDPERNISRGRSRPRSLEDSDSSTSNRSKGDNQPVDKQSEDAESATFEEPEEDLSSERSDNDTISPPNSDKQARKQHLLEIAQDAYAETLDQIASRKEERRLWEILKEDPAEKMPSEKIPTPKAPRAERKSKEDLVDWRTWVHYAREWEVYDSPVPADEFIENQSHGRKEDLAAGLTDSDTELEEVSGRSSSRRGALSDEFVRDDESSSEGQETGVDDPNRAGAIDSGDDGHIGRQKRESSVHTDSDINEFNDDEMGSSETSRHAQNRDMEEREEQLPSPHPHIRRSPTCQDFSSHENIEIVSEHEREESDMETDVDNDESDEKEEVDDNDGDFRSRYDSDNAESSERVRLEEEQRISDSKSERQMSSAEEDDETQDMSGDVQGMVSTGTLESSSDIDYEDNGTDD